MIANPNGHVQGPPSLRARLVDLLDEFDHSPRGTEDQHLAAYLRACVSALDATRLRVTLLLRCQEPGPRPHPAVPARAVLRPQHHEALHRGNLRPDATYALVQRRLALHTGEDT